MSKEQFEQNLDSNFIQFRIKNGEKREIYDYARKNGFDNISAFIKTLIFERIRGNNIKKEEIKQEINEDLMKEMNALKKQNKEILKLIELGSLWRDIKDREEKDK